MAKNDFKVFATSDDANVLSQDDYEELAARSSGFQSGVANAAQLNKVWRQSSIMSAVLAQFIVDRTGRDALDDGLVSKLSMNLSAAVFNDVVLTGRPAAPTPDDKDISTRVATTEFVSEKLKVTQPALGFIPVQQGTGIGQGSNAVKIGWSDKARLKATVDSTDLGSFVFDSQFDSLQSDNGYQRLPGGLIIQWGYAFTNADGYAEVVFPKRFPTACYNIVANHSGAGPAMVIIVAGTLTQTGVTLRVFDALAQTASGWAVYWQATGK